MHFNSSTEDGDLPVEGEKKREKVKRENSEGQKKMVCNPSSLLLAAHPRFEVLIEIEGESSQCGVGHT